MIGMKIYYVRHGQTDLNLAKKMQGGGTEKELNDLIQHLGYALGLQEK